jgi:hypothetical protein
VVIQSAVAQFVGPLSLVLGPLVSAYAQTYLGNTFSQKRGAVLPSFSGVFLTELILGTLTNGVFALLYGGGALVYVAGVTMFFGIIGAANPLIGLAMMFGGLGAMIVGLGVLVPGRLVTRLGSQMLGAYLYHRFGEEKAPGDEGGLEFELPGFWRSNYPKMAEPALNHVRDGRKRAMAY